jgi:hypothetical protein
MPSVSAMPTSPDSSSGRRPMRSISAMASAVAAMLIPSLTMLMASESLAPKPTASQRVVP